MELLDLVAEMRQSVSEYNISGSEALARALTKSIGVIAFNKENLETYKESPEIINFINIIHKIDDIQHTATNNKFTLLLNAAAGITALSGKYY